MKYDYSAPSSQPERAVDKLKRESYTTKLTLLELKHQELRLFKDLLNCIEIFGLGHPETNRVAKKHRALVDESFKRLMAPSRQA